MTEQTEPKNQKPWWETATNKELNQHIVQQLDKIIQLLTDQTEPKTSRRQKAIQQLKDVTKLDKNQLLELGEKLKKTRWGKTTEPQLGTRPKN